MGFSRRTFSKGLLACLPFAADALSCQAAGFVTAIPAPPSVDAWPPTTLVGLNAWSLRALKHNQAIPAILSVMQDTSMRDCQFLFSQAEPEEFDPDFASMMAAAGRAPTQEEVEQRRRKSEARAAWRASVPMTYFEELRTQFDRRKLRIRGYFAPLDGSVEEINRLFLMAKTLGAEVLNSRLPESQTDVAAAAAERHGMVVGIQVSDQDLLARQLRSSHRLTANPDLGDITKAGGSALEFLKEHLDRVSSIDLKDAIAHGASVPFGTGEANMPQVFELLAARRSSAPLYIDCDYPGTGASSDEVKTCVRYVRALMNR